MSYKIETIGPFRREAKRLIKKYPSLKAELASLGLKLAQNPILGTALGNNCFKIRLAIASKGKGTSGGARIITHLYIEEETVFLLSIYDKSETESLSNHHIKALLELIR